MKVRATVYHPNVLVTYSAVGDRLYHAVWAVCLGGGRLRRQVSSWQVHSISDKAQVTQVTQVTQVAQVTQVTQVAQVTQVT
jgi:predicted Fe-S protein YdhL (DUF1289 family)